MLPCAGVQTARNAPASGGQASLGKGGERMRRAKTLFGVLVIGLCAVSVAQRALAFPAYARASKAACAACHMNVAGGPGLTDLGTKYKADPTTVVPAGVKGADYVGSNKCKMCHSKQFKGWQATKHAGAWAGLQHSDPKAAHELAEKLGVKLEGKPETVDGCVQCHVTGFHLPGGYPGADSVKAAALINVTCENCHGPGSMHVVAKAEDRKKLINKDIGAKLCMQCHTAITSPKFNFDEYKKLGVHVVAAAVPAPAK